jgi:hypothetical protein
MMVLWIAARKGHVLDAAHPPAEVHSDVGCDRDKLAQHSERSEADVITACWHVGAAQGRQEACWHVPPKYRSTKRS